MYNSHPTLISRNLNHALHDQPPPGGGGGPGGIRHPPQPRHHVPANDPPVRRREYVAVDAVHDPAVLGYQIAEILESRVALHHARGEVADEPEEGEEDPVHRPGDRPVRPLLHPRPQRGERGANDAPPHDPLDGLVRARLPGGGAYGAELRPAVPATGKVPAHVAEGDAQPRPEDEVGTDGYRETYGLGEEGREVAV